MKRVWQHPTGPDSGKKYWRSLDELAETPEFREALEREFPAGAQELETDGVTRRAFLRLMGASVALAGVGMAGCRRPELHAVPLAVGPEWIISGKITPYATTVPHRSGGIPVMVHTFEGRPTHLEGFGDGLNAQVQASILDLYDPDRSKGYCLHGKESTGAKFREFFVKTLESMRGNGGENVAVLLEPSCSPTEARLLKELAAKYPKLLLAGYDALGRGAVHEATRVVYGQPMEQTLDLSEARVILALGNDFCDGHEEGPAVIRGFTSGRRVRGKSDGMNRLYAVESRLTSTGSTADHRLALPTSQQFAFLAAVAGEVARLLSHAGLAQAVREAAAGQVTWSDLQQQWIKELAADLVASKKGCVLVGREHVAATHVLGIVLNEALGAVGSIVEFVPATMTGLVGLDQLVERMQKGSLETLFVLGPNPALTAPSSLQWTAAADRVKVVVHLSHLFDETSQTAAWHVPLAHFLESWGDAWIGHRMYGTVQPMILPLWDGVSVVEMLAALLGKVEALEPYAMPLPKALAKPTMPTAPMNAPLPIGAQLVRETFAQLSGLAGNALEAGWKETLQAGRREQLRQESWKGEARFQAAAQFVGKASNQPAPVVAGAYELALFGDTKLDDGRYANNGWLQELPDFANKLTWDNVALVSVKTAEALGIRTGDVVRLSLGGRSIEIAAMISPGQADPTISVALGYGRRGIGRVAEGVGVNAYPLLQRLDAFTAVGLQVEKTGRRYPLATTQLQGTMEGRALVREATLEQYREVPDFAKKMHVDSHMPPNANIYPHPYADPKEKGPKFMSGIVADTKHQWGMVIDLTTCVGCNVCAVACQSENNIPIVGKDQVANQRVMNWVRIDRYYSDSPHDPQVAMQPVMCFHCENAPCEAVCPVNATVHTEDGLNVIAYNRCIGTRYCMNNCPYKVRRFNYFDYNKRDVLGKFKLGPIEIGNLYLGPLGEEGSPETVQLQRNPNVTVRMRGVVEKCTFCLQRIEDAKAQTLIEARDSKPQPIRTDSFQTACQTSCPAGAITFGNIADEKSEVSKLRGSDREYALLGYLNTRPRLTYLARLRNPNPKMPGADKIGFGSDWDKVGTLGRDEAHGHDHKAAVPAGAAH